MQKSSRQTAGRLIPPWEVVRAKDVLWERSTWTEGQVWALWSKVFLRLLVWPNCERYNNWWYVEKIKYHALRYFFCDNLSLLQFKENILKARMDLTKFAPIWTVLNHFSLTNRLDHVLGPLILISSHFCSRRLYCCPCPRCFQYPIHVGTVLPYAEVVDHPRSCRPWSVSSGTRFPHPERERSPMRMGHGREWERR